MLEILEGYNPILLALLATLFTWALTAAGAAMIYLPFPMNRKTLDGLLGFAAGVMIAASYWSLLAPAIEMTESSGSSLPSWLPAAGGFVTGAVFLRIIDKFLPHLHPGLEQPEGIKTSWQRSILLVLAITLHNIPEGLAVGVAFGAVASGLPEASIGGAIALALGIGIQNFPEGTAVSMPLFRDGLSKRKCFMYGQLSGIVEPIAGVLGALAVVVFQPILPFTLAFAAGAMSFGVVEELIPESQAGGNTDLATMGTIVGFTVMMVLDVALG
ncbi:MAG: ZIP family metal transporter [Kiritimatiellae bacterium]|nr:ZIP family metal transporter [Kiritimatiellia bacterium]